MKPLVITPIQTDLYRPQELLIDFIMGQVPKELWQERSVLAITSKIISLFEHSVAPSSANKKDLIVSQSDHYLGEIGHGVRLAIKHNLILPAAGIDESNSEHGEFILHPVDPFKSAEKLYRELKERTGLKEFAVVVTDSHSKPLRHGVTGAALSFWGLHPIKNMVGQKDLFGRELKMTKVNHVDSLAAAAVLMMGEANERCPLAMIQHAPVSFTDQNTRDELFVPVEQDMYLPVYQHLLPAKNK